MNQVLPRPARPRRLRIAGLAIAIAGLVGTSIITSASPASAADVLLTQAHTATASSVENGGAAAANAVDGNNGTRWSSAFSNPQWLQVDLGATAQVNQVVLRWRAYATAFQIQVSASGGDPWTTIYSTTTGTGGNQTLNVSGSGRYIRLYATARATQYGVSLWEFQAYGTGGAPGGGGGGGGGPIVRVAEFLADCPFTHRLPDDPIVFPGLPGASHSHDFFGNVSTNAHSTVESLTAAPSNCNPAIDLSSYWVPTLYLDNVAVAPVITTFYYLGEGIRDDLLPTTQALPFGLRIVAGNAKATGPNDNTISRWSCLHHNEVGSSHDFVTCPAGSMMESYLDFPQCWNGTTLDSPDHKSHMAYPVNNACPASHPVAVPKVRQVLRYPVNGNPLNRIRLSSGGGFTMHGDFFNAWPVAEMERRVRDCIRPKIKCGANGTP